MPAEFIAVDGDNIHKLHVFFFKKIPRFSIEVELLFVIWNIRLCGVTLALNFR